jgi:hypothetical protein
MDVGWNVVPVIIIIVGIIAIIVSGLRTKTSRGVYE